MKKKGFTLIELLAVIVILAIIALIAYPTVLNIIVDARESAVRESTKRIAKAAETHYIQEFLKNRIIDSIDLQGSILKYKGTKPDKGNILFDDELEKAYLIDFDSCLEINQTLGSTISFSKETIEYLKHNKLDYRLDIYNFNLATLMSLSNKNVVEILEKINEGTSLLIEENKDIKRLSRELILDDRKTYSGEYIVDYL